MQLAHEMGAAFGVITDLVNTSRARARGADLLDDPTTIDRISEQTVSYSPEHTGAEDVELRQLRHRLEEFLRNEDTQERISLVNSLLLAAGSVPQLATHVADETPHFHYTMEDASFSSKITALCAMGLARLLASQSEHRFRVCEGTDCEKVFIDVSKNASRRYCDSQTCGNRLHAARYRARRGSQADTPAS